MSLCTVCNKDEAKIKHFCYECWKKRAKIKAASIYMDNPYIADNIKLQSLLRKKDKKYERTRYF